VKTLIFGKTGQVASEVSQMEGVLCFSHFEAVSPDSTKKIFKISPETVINTVSYMAFDKGGEKEVVAEIINGDAPKETAETCKDLGEIIS